MARSGSSKRQDSPTTIGFEAKLWLADGQICNNTDAAEYTHVLLGPIFLK